MSYHCESGRGAVSVQDLLPCAAATVYFVITRLWTQRQDIILYSINVQTGSGGLPSLLYRGYRVSFLGVELPEREFDYSLPSVAQVRIKWSFSAYPVSFRDLDSYIFWLFAVIIVLRVRRE